jgi:hypothetical protein
MDLCEVHPLEKTMVFCFKYMVIRLNMWIETLCWPLEWSGSDTLVDNVQGPLVERECDVGK